MIGLTALALGILTLVLGQPPRSVVRVRRLTAPASHKNLGTEKVASVSTKRKRSSPSKRLIATEVDIAILLDLVAVSLRAGSPVPTVLSAVGIAVEGENGAALQKIAAHLSLGADWDSAWNSEIPTDLEPVRVALAPAWLSGAPVTALLDHAKRRVRRQRATLDEEAAKRLAVRLILPVAFCYLPAFVVLGLLPVILTLFDQGFSLL